jgi:hypothetical protein
MPTLISFRLVAACALALTFALSGVASASAKAVPASLRVVGPGGKVLSERSLKAGSTSIKTSAKATCFGPGSGGSGKSATLKGVTAMSLLVRASKSDGALRPIAISDHFDFGLALCGVGGYMAHGSSSWYLKVNHKSPPLGGDAVKLKPGDEVLWDLAPSYPYPDELALKAPDRVKAGKAFKVRVFSYDSMGKRKPAAGVKVTGAQGRTGADGRATVVLKHPARLIARVGKSIPSNREAVCLGKRCPRGANR